MSCGLELKVPGFETLLAQCQGVNAVYSELKHKFVSITYSTKRLEYYKQYVCVKKKLAEAPVLYPNLSQN